MLQSSDNALRPSQGLVDVLPHPKFYFPSGDIIISCLSSVQTVQFKVDKVILSRHSPIFRDMFAIPLPPSPDMIDGVHVLHLSDSAEDVAGLLDALYNPLALAFPRRHPDTPVKASGILRMAKKYEIEPVQKVIINHIENDWPRSLSDWDILQAEITNTRICDERRDLNDSLPEPGAALRFAIDF
ncbi:hypothetical protein C8Q75DRAFT_715554, partial [Abortiporus biennis]